MRVTFLPLAERERRLQILRDLDVEEFRGVLAWTLGALAAEASTEALLIAMHKSRYAVTSLEDEYRLASAEWLRERNYQSLKGEELLPPGELPR